MKENTKKTAFAAIMISLGVALMYLGSLVEVLDLSAAAMSSLIIVICMAELGGYYPVSVFAATGILAFIVLPGKTVSLAYILFFGYYPIVKKLIERFDKPFSYILKFILINVIGVGYYFISKQFFPDLIEGVKWYLAIVLNAAFFVFDRLLTVLLLLYAVKLRNRLRIDKFFSKNH